MDRKGAVDQPPASIVIPSSAFQGGPFPPETASATSPPVKAVQEENDIPPPVKAVQEEATSHPRESGSRPASIAASRCRSTAGVAAQSGAVGSVFRAVWISDVRFSGRGRFRSHDVAARPHRRGHPLRLHRVTSGPPRPKRQPSTVVVPTKSTPPSIYDTEVMKANATAPLEEGGDVEEPARSRQHASSDKSTRGNSSCSTCYSWCV